MFNLQSKEEIYILNADGVPKRIAKSQWRLFHKRVEEIIPGDEAGNTHWVLKRREDYLKYKMITKEQYEKMSGLKIIDGRWQPYTPPKPQPPAKPDLEKVKAELEAIPQKGTPEWTALSKGEKMQAGAKRKKLTGILKESE